MTHTQTAPRAITADLGRVVPAVSGIMEDGSIVCIVDKRVTTDPALQRVAQNHLAARGLKCSDCKFCNIGLNRAI